MKHVPSSDNPIFLRLQHTEQTLTCACGRFVELHRGVDLSDEQAAGLIATLTENHGIVGFSRNLRNHIHPGRHNTAPFWAMIDAVGFWEDAHPGVWPYMSEPDWGRRIDWAEDQAKVALSFR